ncbi:MAG: energy-coupling factor transporter transmembrane component T family protein [Beduini sp.]|uniref:energy-coupling factor transporter transmembrane component T family protein n=1 Tax=Beduini sp. TaxID=1922300 RepID=UPI0011CA99E1
MGNMTLGKYLPFDSFIHRLDPRMKIVSLLFLLISVFFDAGFIGYGIIGLFVCLVVVLSKIKITYILKSLKPMIFMMSFLMILNVFMIQKGTILFSIGPLTVYSGGLIQTAYILIRLVLIVALTTVLTATTKPLDLTLGLEHLFNPLRKIGFPAHEVSMMISIALRFIPTLLEETERIMKAQASRGVDFKEGSLKDKVKAIVSLIVPLFISAFQRAEDLANAMESRGYNPDGKRTKYKVLKWRLSDTLSLLTTVVMCVGIIVMSVI